MFSPIVVPVKQTAAYASGLDISETHVRPPRSSTDPPLAAAVPRPGRAPRPANVPGPLPRPIWSASAPRRAGCGSSRGRASCARRPHRSRQLLCHQRAPQPRPNCPCSRSRLQPRSRISCARRHHHPRQLWAARARRAVRLQLRAPPPRPEPARPRRPPKLALPAALLYPHTCAPPPPSPARRRLNPSAPTGPRPRPSRPARGTWGRSRAPRRAPCAGAAGDGHGEASLQVDSSSCR